MNKKSKNRFTWIIIIVLVLGGIFLLVSTQSGPGKFDTFATCLKEKGAVFYGAFWCPHCQNQKKLFGKSARLLPYVECSTPNGRSTTKECQEKNIQGYPTWEFTDGSRETGEISLQKLSEKTSCPLP